MWSSSSYCPYSKISSRISFLSFHFRHKLQRTPKPRIPEEGINVHDQKHSHSLFLQKLKCHQHSHMDILSRHFTASLPAGGIRVSMRHAITDSLNWCLFKLLAGHHSMELRLQGFKCNTLRHLPIILYQAIKVGDKEDTLSLHLVFFSLSSHFP